MVRLFLCPKGGVDMKNEYKFYDDKKICTIFFIDRTSFTIDANDFELISKYTWFRGKRGYPTAHFSRKTKTASRTFTLHRLLFGFPKNVDMLFREAISMAEERACICGSFSSIRRKFSRI